RGSEKRQSTAGWAGATKLPMSTETAESAERQLPIFAYGTLRRGEPAEDLLARDVTRRAPARAKGRLLAIGAPYPAAVFSPDAAEHVNGELMWLAPGSYAATLDRVD